LSWILVVDGGGQLPEMFAGVIKIEAYDGIREGELCVFSNPSGPITDEDEPFGMLESAPRTS
jgi:hypothetical protein